MSPDERAAALPWKVDSKGMELIKGGRMTAGCRHRKGKTIACGGCYARAIEALTLISEGADGKALANRIFEIMKNETA